MIGALFGLLLIPASATVAGLVLWAGWGRQELEDGELVRNFVILFALCMAVGWWAGGTKAVRQRVDPQFRVQTELEGHPLYSTLKRLAPDDHKALHDFLTSEMSRGRTLAEAFLQARPVLERLATRRLGFADQKTHLAWGRLIVDTLGELQSRDPVLCYRVLSSQPLDPQTLGEAFSAANTTAFQRAVIEVYESADRGMRHERPADDKPVDFNAAALEYRAIQQLVAGQFGAGVASQLDKSRISQPTTESPQQMCAARITQLKAMLERPQPMAAMLIDSVLR